MTPKPCAAGGRKGPCPRHQDRSASMRIITVAGPIVGLSLLLAACGSGGATTAPTAAPVASTAPSAAASAAASGSPAAAGPVSVSLADASLGKILVDGTGKTLYVFLADTGGTSVCYDK